MIGHVLGAAGRIGGPLGHTQYRASAAVQWWLSGGVSAANAVAVYQPKGATSLAASYSNLASPGTYDAAPGVAPSFDAATGWTFDGSTQYLTTGVVPANDQTWSMLIRFSNRANQSALAAGWTTAAYGRGFGVWLYNAGNYYDNGNELYAASGAHNSGVVGIAGNKGYRDGRAEAGTIGGWTGTSLAQIPIGALFVHSTGNYSNKYAGKIQALAIYNTTLSAAQALAISSAMAAL
jgi:hypothetical protein